VVEGLLETCVAFLPAWQLLRLPVSGALLGALLVIGSGCGTALGDSDAVEFARRAAALSGADADTTHSGVLALVTVTRQEIELCTGSLITPNLLLTARHCVSPTSADVVDCSSAPASFAAPYDVKQLWVNRSAALSGPLGSFGYLPLEGGSDEFLPVARIFVPDSSDVCGNDVALLLLGAAFDGTEAAPLAPRLDQVVKTGEGYTAVGFGATPAASGEGVRRSRADLAVACSPADCDTGTGFEADEFGGGDGVCSGDSGGPALDAEGRVAGIASRASNCQNSVYSASPDWADLIRFAAARAVAAGDYPAPSWLEAPPPAAVPDPESAPVAPPAPDAGAAPAAVANAPDAGPASPVADTPAPVPAPDPLDSAPENSSCNLGATGSEPLGGLGFVGAALLVALRRRGPRGSEF
jgi:hypothetical protein